MRKLFVPAALALVASGAYAQELPEGVTQERIEWDGTAEVYWKIFYPSGASDAFSVDMDLNNHDALIVGMGVQSLNTQGTNAAAAAAIGIFKDNLVVDPTGTTPDLNNSLSGLAFPQDVDAGVVDRDCYNIPDVCIPSSCATHLVNKSVPGDSQIWLGSDTNGAQFGNSYFTTDNYNTPAIPFTVNWVLGVDVIPKACPVFWINGGTSAKVFEKGTVCFLFRGCCNFQPFMLFLSVCGGSIVVPAINLVLFTGIGAVDDAGFTGSICAAWPCDVVPNGTMLCFRAVYKECSPSKKIAISNEVKITICDNLSCAGCFGMVDDGVLDATIWKVQNPAGSADWFNVEQGDPLPATNTLTSVDVASWNFCAVAAPWDEVGVYDSNLTLDPTGGTPQLPALAAVNGQNVPAAQSDWGYPATNYNHADVAVSGSEHIHSATKWPTGDSCVWIGSDTDGLDSTTGCEDLSASYFTLDGYNTPAILFSPVAWMMKVYWQ